MKLFLSCPRNAQSRELIAQANALGVGLVGIGTSELDGYCGSSHPLMREKWLDGSEGFAQQGLAAHEALYQLAVTHKNLTVITTAPLTDVALCLCAHPDLPQYVQKLLIVGGSDSFGDVTPAAERNFYNDPEAAQMVLKSGIPIVLFGLNITRNLANPMLLPLQYLQNPEKFVTESAGVYVETQATLTLGKAVNDLYSDKQFAVKNVEFVMQIL